MKRNRGIGSISLPVVVVLVVSIVIGLLLFLRPVLGIYPFGPREQVTATVDRVYVDYSGTGDSQESSYMVATDHGVFEVDNSLWLGIWNADKTYGKIKEGHTYRFEVKGREVLNLFFQEYPGITTASEVLPKE